MQTSTNSLFGGFKPHIEDHIFVAYMVKKENKRLMEEYRKQGISVSEPIGVMALDLRLSDLASSHHQKMMVIRKAGGTHVAFCGGVDLAYTRRDAPDDPTQFDSYNPQFMQGDWQSGISIPNPQDGWPKQASGILYQTKVKPPEEKLGNDLRPLELYGFDHQIWHDQHLRLEGPIVVTLEEQFRERWIDTTASDKDGQYGAFPLPEDMGEFKNWKTGQVFFSTEAALDQSGHVLALGQPVPFIIRPLRNPLPLPPSEGSSIVQMWRTIPIRRGTRTGPPFQRGEFTVMAGIAKACKASTELIWIFDQYFWSRPLARLLNDCIKKKNSLCVVIVLPPLSDVDNTDTGQAQHQARRLALTDLKEGLAQIKERIAIYNLWDFRSKDPKGIYCHAKMQLYDNSLLVCGSANLNRRSFTCDTELACAVLDTTNDRAVIRKHRENLWKLVLPYTEPPQLNFDQPGWGKNFFKAFQETADKRLRAKKTVFVVPDPWYKGQSEVRLPNEDYKEFYPLLKTSRVHSAGETFNFYYGALDPSSITLQVEEPVYVDKDHSRDCCLDDIVDRIENPGQLAVHPWWIPSRLPGLD